MSSLQRPQTLIERASSFGRQTRALQDTEEGIAPSSTARESAISKAVSFFEDKYTRGEFKDPPSQRAYPLGPKIFTPGHKTLIHRLREECQALSHQVVAGQDRYKAAESKNKAQTEVSKKSDALLADMRQALQRHSDETITLKTRLRAKDEEIVRLTNEMAETHNSLNDLDRSLSTVRAKRRSWMPTSPVDLEAFGVPFVGKGKAKEA